MSPQFQAIKGTSVVFTTNKNFQGCVGRLGGFKRSDTLGMLICCGYADNVVLNLDFDFFCHHLWRLEFTRREPHTTSPEFFNDLLRVERALKVARYLMAMIYPPNISLFVENKNLQIVMKISSVLFNTQVKALKHDGYFLYITKCTKNIHHV